MIAERPGATFSVEEAVTSVYENNLCLSLDREMMAFLVGLYIFGQRVNQASLSDTDLKDVFSLLNSLSFGEDETLLRRTNNAINRLKEQGFLSRMDLIGGATYVLTALGKAVGQHWENAEVITQRNLIHYTGELRIRLEQVLEAASHGGDENHWMERVELPLRETISELINSIDKRQQGMAAAQKKIQREISDRISTDWLAGIGACEKMLSTTGSALEELHTIILHEADSVQEVLEHLADRCLEQRQKPASEAVDMVQGQMEMVRNWADFSFQEWSRYFHSIHDFIRLNVRTDPNRHLADRIKTALKHYDEAPWGFRFPAPSHYLHLREEAFEKPVEEVEITGHVSRPPVVLAEAEDHSVHIRIQREVKLRLERDGSVDLVDVLAALLPELSHEETFMAAGELVGNMAELGVARRVTRRIWAKVGTDYEVQNLTVVARREHP